MGFNTVAMLLNDRMHELLESPRTLAWTLCHPPHSNWADEMASLKKQIDSVAKDHGERSLSHYYGNGITIHPTFHADFRPVLYAGNNQLIPLVEVGRKQVKGSSKVLITLELPGR